MFAWLFAWKRRMVVYYIIIMAGLSLIFSVFSLFSPQSSSQGNGWDNYAQEEKLENAVKDKNLPRAVFLLKQGGNPNGEVVQNHHVYSLLMVAAKQGDLPMVKALLHAGARVKDKADTGEMALDFAKKYRHSEVVKCLVQASSQPNAEKGRYLVGEDALTEEEYAAKKQGEQSEAKSRLAKAQNKK